MLSGLGLGTYKAGDSIAHRLDGRTKIIALFCVMVASFGALHLYYFGVIVAALILSSVVARVDQRAMFRSMAIVLVLLAISTFVYALLIPGKPEVRVGPFSLSHDGIQLGVRIFFQSGALIYGAQILTFSTAPLAIATALQRLCRPLKAFRVPVDELAMLITLALTFLPLIREQVRTVIDAQLARGTDLRHGPIETRFRAILSLYNPIITANLRRAGELATAMEARGYRVGSPRSHLREQSFSTTDYVVFLLSALLVAAAFVV
ncbi:MAG: transporter [Chloroflexi bacterium]|jgi:energy-coupling factor transport system permease protein|nr:transporter [Chloroflexota bacterium]